MSSSDSGGAANKRTKNSNYLLGTRPGALEVSYEKKQVWVVVEELSWVFGERDIISLVYGRCRQVGVDFWGQGGTWDF